MTTPPSRTAQIESLTSIVLSAANLVKSQKARKVTEYVTTGLAVLALTKQVQTFIEQVKAPQKQYVLTVSSTDSTYYRILDWVLDQIPNDERTSLTVTTSSCNDLVEGDEAAPLVKLRYDGKRAIRVTHNGHAISVEAIPAEPTGTRVAKMASIAFSAKSGAGRDAVLELIASFVDDEVYIDPPRLFAPGPYGWNVRSDLQLRSIESVILREGQRESLVEDLQQFLDCEEKYAQLGVPWHRGYCFYGPPGTGKTSLARALASHLGLSVYYLPLNDLRNDTNLMDLFADMPERCVLLLEDVDSVHAAVSREDEGQGRVSISGLLNALDGVVTSHGLVTIMTTNNFEALDPALVRPGRMDRAEELGYLNDESLGRLMEMLLGHPVELPKMTRAQITPSDVLGVFLRHIQAPTDSVQAVADFVAPPKPLKLVA